MSIRLASNPYLLHFDLIAEKSTYDSNTVDYQRIKQEILDKYFTLFSKYHPSSNITEKLEKYSKTIVHRVLNPILTHMARTELENIRAQFCSEWTQDGIPYHPNLHQVASNVVRTFMHMHKVFLRKIIGIYLKPTVDNNTKKMTMQKCINEEIAKCKDVEDKTDASFWQLWCQSENLQNALHRGLLELDQKIVMLEWCSDWMNEYMFWCYKRGPGFVLTETNPDDCTIEWNTRNNTIIHVCSLDESLASINHLTCDDMYDIIHYAWTFDSSEKSNTLHTIPKLSPNQIEDIKKFRTDVENKYKHEQEVFESQNNSNYRTWHIEDEEITHEFRQNMTFVTSVPGDGKDDWEDVSDSDDDMDFTQDPQEFVQISPEDEAKEAERKKKFERQKIEDKEEEEERNLQRITLQLKTETTEYYEGNRKSIKNREKMIQAKIDTKNAKILAMHEEMNQTLNRMQQGSNAWKKKKQELEVKISKEEVKLNQMTTNKKFVARENQTVSIKEDVSNLELEIQDKERRMQSIAQNLDYNKKQNQNQASNNMSEKEKEKLFEFESLRIEQDELREEKLAKVNELVKWETTDKQVFVNANGKRSGDGFVKYEKVPKKLENIVVNPGVSERGRQAVSDEQRETLPSWLEQLLEKAQVEYDNRDQGRISNTNNHRVHKTADERNRQHNKNRFERADEEGIERSQKNEDLTNQQVDKGSREERVQNRQKYRGHQQDQGVSRGGKPKEQGSSENYLKNNEH